MAVFVLFLCVGVYTQNIEKTIIVYNPVLSGSLLIDVICFVCVCFCVSIIYRHKNFICFVFIYLKLQKYIFLFKLLQINTQYLHFLFKLFSKVFNFLSVFCFFLCVLLTHYFSQSYGFCYCFYDPFYVFVFISSLTVWPKNLYLITILLIFCCCIVFHCMSYFFIAAINIPHHPCKTSYLVLATLR